MPLSLFFHYYAAFCIFLQCAYLTKFPQPKAAVCNFSVFYELIFGQCEQFVKILQFTKKILLFSEKYDKITNINEVYVVFNLV